MLMKTDHSFISEFTKAVGFILAGGYIANAIHPNIRINGVLSISNCFVFGVGLFVLIFGIVYTIITPFWQRIQSQPPEKFKVIKSLFTRIEVFSKFLLPVVFVATLFKLVTLTSDFLGINFSLVGGIFILVILLLGIIYEYSKKLFSFHFLIYFSAVLVGSSALTMVLDDFEHMTFIKISLGLSVVMLLYAVYLLQKTRDK
jgi:hypothetical protein